MSPQYFGIFVCFVIQINSVYFVYDDDVCGIEISSLPIYVGYLSMLYRYVDILTGDRMIVGISIFS